MSIYNPISPNIIDEQTLKDTDNFFKETYLTMLAAIIRLSDYNHAIAWQYVRKLSDSMMFQCNIDEISSASAALDNDYFMAFISIFQNDKQKSAFAVDLHIICLICGVDNESVLLFSARVLSLLEFAVQDIKLVKEYVNTVVSKKNAISDIVRVGYFVQALSKALVRTSEKRSVAPSELLKRSLNISVSGHVLQNQDEQQREKYLSVLVPMMGTTYRNSDSGWTFLYELAADIGLSEKFAKIIGVDANTTDIALELYYGNELLTNVFALDTILTYLYCNTEDEGMLRYVALLFSLLGLTNKRIKELCTFAKIIYHKNADELYNFLHKNHLTDYSVFSYYFMNFAKSIQGEVINNTFTVSYPIKMELRLGYDIPHTYSEQKNVLFENVVFSKAWHNFKFTGCEDVKIVNCVFSQVLTPVLELTRCHSLTIENCEFVLCRPNPVGKLKEKYLIWPDRLDMQHYYLQSLRITLKNVTFRSCGDKSDIIRKSEMLEFWQISVEDCKLIRDGVEYALSLD